MNLGCLRPVELTRSLSGICPGTQFAILNRPYRHQGLGSKLIHHVLSTAADSLAQPPPPTPSSPAPSSTLTPKPNGTTPAAPLKGGKASSSAKPEPTKKDAKEDYKEEEKKEPLKPRVESVYLHVQVGNDEAKRFWEKWGFEVKVREAEARSFRSLWLAHADVAFFCSFLLSTSFHYVRLYRC